MSFHDAWESINADARDHHEYAVKKLFLLSLLFWIMVFQQACAAKPPLPPVPPPIQLSPTAVVLSFPANPGAAAPRRVPETAEEWVLCGIFEYDHGNFAEAAHAFAEASRATLNPMSPFVRETLLAQAICYLRDANDIDFLQVMESLLSSYNRWELSQARERDPRLRVLEQIYQQRSKVIQ